MQHLYRMETVMRLKFVAVAGAAAMLVSSTAALAVSPLDQRPSQLRVSDRAGEDLEDASSINPALLALILAALAGGGYALSEALDDNTSPS
jgi:hypothetical protein